MYHLKHCSILRLVLLGMVSGLAVIFNLLSMGSIVLSYLYPFLSQMKVFALESVLLYLGKCVCLGRKAVKLAKLIYVIIGITKCLCALNNLEALVINCELKISLKFTLEM